MAIRRASLWSFNCSVTAKITEMSIISKRSLIQRSLQSSFVDGKILTCFDWTIFPVF